MQVLHTYSSGQTPSQILEFLEYQILCKLFSQKNIYFKYFAFYSSTSVYQTQISKLV